MKKKRSKRKKKTNLGQEFIGEDVTSSPFYSVSLDEKINPHRYFLGFKRKEPYNELWRWDDLENVKF